MRDGEFNREPLARAEITSFNQARLKKVKTTAFNMAKKLKANDPELAFQKDKDGNKVLRFALKGEGVITKDAVKGKEAKEATATQAARKAVKAVPGHKIMSLDFFVEENHFSNVASWAWWENDRVRVKPANNEEPYEYFPESKLPEIGFRLNPQVVFLGVNAGQPAVAVPEAPETDEHNIITLPSSAQKTYIDFKMFHSSAAERGKFMPVLKNLENLRGGYITDLFKLMPTADGGKLQAVFDAMDKQNYKNLIDVTNKMLKTELQMIGGEKGKRKLIIVMQSIGSQWVVNSEGVEEKQFRTMATTQNFVVDHFRTTGFFENGYEQGCIARDKTGYYLRRLAPNNEKCEYMPEPTFIYDENYVVCWMPHYSGHDDREVEGRKKLTVSDRIEAALQPINAVYEDLLIMKCR